MKKSIIAILTTSLFACGGGGESAETPDNVPKATEVMPIGLWQGSAVTDGVTFQIAGLIAPDGEIRFIADDGEQNKGMITLDGDKYTISLKSYNDDGIFIGDGSVSGDYSSTAITGETSHAGEVTSTFSLTVSPESSDGASLSTITGNYATLDGLASIAIDVDGLISGSDDDGCVYGGSLTVPDSTVNVYDISLEVSNCGQFNDTYNGLATYATPFDDSNQKGLIFQVDNGAYSITDFIVK